MGSEGEEGVHGVELQPKKRGRDGQGSWSINALPVLDGTVTQQNTLRCPLPEPEVSLQPQP